MVVFIFGQQLIVSPAIERDVLDLVDLLQVGPVTPLYIAVDLGSEGRIHEQHDLGSLTGLFELVHKLQAAIDLDGLGPKRKLHLQIVEGVGHDRAGLPFVGLHPPTNLSTLSQTLNWNRSSAAESSTEDRVSCSDRLEYNRLK